MKRTDFLNALDTIPGETQKTYRIHLSDDGNFLIFGSVCWIKLPIMKLSTISFDDYGFNFEFGKILFSLLLQRPGLPYQY